MWSRVLQHALLFTSHQGKLIHKKQGAAGSAVCSETAPLGWFLAKYSIPGEKGWLDEGFEVPPLPEERMGLRRM